MRHPYKVQTYSNFVCATCYDRGQTKKYNTAIGLNQDRFDYLKRALPFIFQVKHTYSSFDQ